MWCKSINPYPYSNNSGKLSELIEVSVSFLCVFFNIKGWNMAKEMLLLYKAIFKCF